MRGNKYISNSQRFLDGYVFVLNNSNSLTKRNVFTYVCIRICFYIKSCKKSRVVYLIQIDGAQNVSRMRMCIECVTQVPKQKNLQNLFLLGW